ncbi:hypothetical protein GC089_15405 [Cellulomonas sp. JZ18]|uniref:hypothetical protein n=1 Tax=Cellulomonas sp. JZ18 TaxID=2654191 RepID=UPI0012D418CC|nr:hypothetical protein [Cellulomonas sp. JZ18]QGQ20320.1 hypothetical protein GC089_15405 [Cellulomonas sp. JZ18]
MLLASYDSYDSGAAAGAVVGMLFLGLLYAAIVAFGVYLYMRVARKAGWTLWHGLLVLVPLANLVFIIMFAFQEWPIERRVRELEARLGLSGDGLDPYGHAGPGLPYGHGAPAYAAPGAAPAYGAPEAAPTYGAPEAAPAYGAPRTALPPTAPPPPLRPSRACRRTAPRPSRRRPRRRPRRRAPRPSRRPRRGVRPRRRADRARTRRGPATPWG